MTADEKIEAGRTSALRAVLRLHGLKMLALLAFSLAALVAFSGDPRTANPGNIRIGIQLEPPNLDPTAGASEAIDTIVYGNIFEGLVQLNAAGNVVPALAERWQVSADGKVYDFFLRRGVQFHNGHNFTARDVQFSFDRARGPGSLNAQQAMFRQIAAIEIVDDYHLRVTLSRIVPTFVTFLAWGDAVIVEAGSAPTNVMTPIGTGPFMFRHWQRSTQIDLVAFEGYWGSAVAINSASFRFIPDPAVAQVALRAGDIDIFAGYPAPENFSAFARDTKFDTNIGSTEGETILAINHRQPKLADLRVRRALSMLINRQEVLDGAMFGYGQLISSHFPPNRPGYVDLSDAFPHDVARAQQLLREAGFEGPLSLKLPPPAYARRSGEIIAAQLRRAGVAVRVENIEWAQWIDQIFLRHDFDLTIVAHTEPMDIDIYARPDYYFGYENSEFVTTIDALRGETDSDQRNLLLARAQTILVDDAVNVFLFQLPALTVCRADISGLWQNSPIAAIVLRDIQIGTKIKTDASAFDGCSR